MNYHISTTAQTHAAEVVALLRAYSAASYSPEEMAYSVTLGFDMDDIRRYAHTDQMPVRIRGKLHAVSEKAASCIAATFPVMRQMASDAVSDPAAECARCLEYILSGLRNRRTVTITLIDARSGQLALSMPGSTAQTHHIDPVMVSCLALELDSFDANTLLSKRIDLIPS